MLMSLGLGLGLTLLSASQARAATYVVRTSSIAATTLNANDNYCSLAEAIASINQGSPAYNCPDANPSGPPTIQFRQSASRPYTSNHFVIPSNYNSNIGFEFTNHTNPSVIRGVYVGTFEQGGTAYIDAPTAQAFLVNSRVQATFYGLEIKHTGTGAGRAVKNFGWMWANTCTFRNGNVSSNSPGQGGALFNSLYMSLTNSSVLDSSARVGGGIYNSGTLDIANTVIWGNSATTSGGGVYNTNGTATISSATISGNSATKAGGGIYNLSTALNGSGDPAGSIYATALTVGSNSAKAGGGVFNSGLFDLMGGFVTSNTVSGNWYETLSGETCTMGTSCDGSGGGILSMPRSLALIANVRVRDGATISDNTATELGGAIYTAGVGEIRDVAIERNWARRGAAIYASPQGVTYYCNIVGTIFIDNSVTPAPDPWYGPYSIVDGDRLDPYDDQMQCSFSPLATASAWGNSNPACNPSMVRSSGDPCPQ
jgi:predicted outer membrane repeat protein